jgi:3'-phosphoadenosine 5'-phosphosulfate sulfotransferase (PAPS reductase)/FAD synthetase
VDFRSKTNAVILLDMYHTIRGGHIQEEHEKVGNTKFESVGCVHCGGANTVTLKQQSSLWEGDWEVVKRSGRDESI